MNLGFSEMLFIFLFALIIFGPKKLPEIGRQIGRALAEFKRATNDFKAQLETEMRQIEIQEALKREKDSITNMILPPGGTIPAGNPDVLAEPCPVPMDSEAEAPPHPAAEPAAQPSGSSTEAPVEAHVAADAAVDPEIKSEAAKGPNA